MQATQKQRGFIAEIIVRNELANKVFQAIVKSTPTHNEKYTDPRVNYQYMILAERLTGLSVEQADYIIKAYTGQRGYHHFKALKILSSLNII